MAEPAPFKIGAEIVASDDFRGEIDKVVVEGEEGVLTHLVVSPRHASGLPRLVPAAMVEWTAADGALLRGDTADFEALPPAHGVEFVVNPDRNRADIVVGQESRVQASDGAAGWFRGVIVGPDGRELTHILVDRHRVISRTTHAVPIEDVTAVDNEITVDLPKSEVRHSRSAPETENNN